MMASAHLTLVNTVSNILNNMHTIQRRIYRNSVLLAFELPSSVLPRHCVS